MDVSLPAAPEEPSTERWTALGGVLLSAMYLWIVLWLALAVVLPTVGLGWRPVMITSGSMTPLIRPGDVVLTGPVPEEPLGAGTVITYQDPARPDRVVTHRIVEVEADGAYRTRGDANAVPDSTPVPPSAVIGRGRLLVPLIGLPLLWFSGALALFAVWLAVTVAAAVVVAGRGGRAPAPVRRRGGDPGRPRPRGWWPRVRPRAVQRRVVSLFVCLLSVVERAPRPAAGRMRQWAPTLAVAIATLSTARTSGTVGLGAMTCVLALALDPRGPHLRVGRWHRGGVRAVRVATALVPGAAFTRAMAAILLVGLATSGAVRSSAAFTADTPTSGSSFEAAASFPTPCSGTGTARVLATADTTVIQVAPTANFGAETVLAVRARDGEVARALLEFRSLPSIPVGCRVTSATLQLHTVASRQGRTLVVQRTDVAFDAARVTWNTQPAASGAVGTGRSTANGPTPVDATAPVAALYALGNTGLVVRDSDERTSDAYTNAYNALEGSSEPGQRPHLVITWGP